MTIDEFKSKLQQEDIKKIKAVAAKINDITKEDKDILWEYINTASEALGEDLIAEPVRYIIASMGGLRKDDLQALIGEDFDAETFDAWNNLLDSPILQKRVLLKDIELYDVAPQMRELLREEMGESNFRSCAADIGYYLLEQKQPGDIIRDTQTLHLLLDGMEAAAAAEYVSEINAAQIDMVSRMLSKGIKDAPDYVKATINDMMRAEGEKIDSGKIMILMAAAKLRVAQNARMKNDQTEAQKMFFEALNSLMPMLQQADPVSVSAIYIKEYWLCLKICQEMAQPKAMALIFEQIIKIEKAQTQDINRSEEERGRIAEDIIGQHIDMSKVYYAMPQALQEQFTNYTEPTVALLKTYLSEKPTEELSANDNIKLSGYYQALGELSMHLERHEDSYDALTQAQILQMHQLANMQKEDGADQMSQQQLICRLALSATNHMIAAHYRRQGKSQHDLGIVLRSNMNLAEDCFKFYPRDPKVIHFFINAALELGDYQHNSRGLLAECGTYEKVIRQFNLLNNMNLDQQLAIDVAMIETKCGQVQSDKTIRRYRDAIRNLQTAHQLWKALGENTKNPTFQNNTKAVAEMLEKLKGK